ncbi:hypothetical protein LguiA_024363 [Lonicera macranthoides]
METLSERAAFMRESLQKSQIINDQVVAILGSFDHRLSALETAMRPTQIRTHSIRRAHENIDKTLKAADLVLGQFDLARKAEAKILRGPHEDLESYLEAVDQLRTIVKFFSGNKNLKSSIGVISHAHGLLAKSILKLEEEFRQLLSTYRMVNACKPVEPDRLIECLPSSMRPSSAGSDPSHGGDAGGRKSSSENPSKLETVVPQPPTLIPPRIVPLLHDLAIQMFQAGHQQQLYNIYRHFRKVALLAELRQLDQIADGTGLNDDQTQMRSLSGIMVKEIRAAVVEQSLRKLEVERLNKDDVQKMQWEVLEAKIGNWIHSMRIAVKLLFAAEKKLCDQVFEGIDSLRDQCFAEVNSNSVAVLLSFGEAIARSKRSPEKLFVLLDMYEIMRELQPEFDTIFGSKYCGEMREAALVLTKRLAQTAQETFGDFEEAVEKDATKTAVLDGTVHPLTSYVINYVKFLFDYQSTLKQLFKEFDNSDPDAQLGSVTTRIMQALQTNLEGKSKQYRDAALTQLFLMNNIHYIVRSVRRSEAKDLLGDDWVQIHRRVVQQHANQYKRLSWSKILQCLSIQGISGADGGGTSGVSRANVKERFKTFNVQFEELHQRQSQWTVPDSELRESLRLAVAEVLLPAYRSFVKRFGPLVDSGKNPNKYIRFSPEDLERMLAEFFEGKTWNDPKR